MSLIFPPFGETITVHRETRNNFGDQTPGTSHDEDDCAVWSNTTTEVIVGEDTVAWALTVLCTPDADVLATDRVTVRGTLYDVVGEPILHRSSITGRESGLEVHLNTATG